jgi:F-type H+-transporting ATPase subunit delta
MNESQISVRYAKALFQSALEQKLLEDVYKDMEMLTSTCKLEEFQYMLVVPTLQTSQKIKLMGEIFGKHFSKISLSTINLVVKNKRETYLPGIARYFKDLYRKEKGIRIATLQTAQAVDEKALNGIRGLIKKAYDSEVELTSAVNTDVIGGFILTIEDKQYDASVANNLRRLKKQLLQTSIEKL